MAGGPDLSSLSTEQLLAMRAQLAGAQSPTEATPQGPIPSAAAAPRGFEGIVRNDDGSYSQMLDSAGGVGASTGDAPQQPTAAPAQAPVAAAPATPDLSSMSTEDLLALRAQMAGAPPSHTAGGGDPGTPTDILGRVGRDADTFVRQAANVVTRGFADKIAAGADAIPALLSGGSDAFLKQFSQNEDAQKARDAADRAEAGGASLAGGISGGLVEGALLPEWKGATVLQRAGIGATQAGGLGVLNSLGDSRGDFVSAIPHALQDGAISAAIGAPLGGWLGSRPAKAITGLADDAAAEAAGMPRATAADYASTGIDSMRAITGSPIEQQLAQTLMGQQMLSGALAKKVASITAQSKDFLGRTAGSFGDAADGVEAGSAITNARKTSAANILQLAGQYGHGGSNEAVGLAVQNAVNRFSGVDHHLPILDVARYPVRASSFGAKSDALYDRAWNELDQAIPGGMAQTGDQPIGGPGPRDEVDDILDAIRSGQIPKMRSQGPSLLQFISRKGGVNDAGELRAMDADKWHLGKPGTRKLINPNGMSLGDMAQAAHEAGYFPDKPPPSMSGAGDMQAVSGVELREAMRAELAGRKRFGGSNYGPSIRDDTTRSISDFLDHAGIDVKGKTNGQIRAAMERYEQGKPADAQHIVAPASKAVINDIMNRAQSVHVKGLLDAAEISQVAKAVRSNDGLSFNDLRSLRTWVRQAQKNDHLTNTIGMADLQRMESALTQDISANAERFSPKGTALMRRADNFYGAGQKRIQQALDAFSDSHGRHGAKTFEKILSSAGKGATSDLRGLRGLRRSMQPDDWNEVAATAIRHMGATADGEFDFGRFVTAYDKMSPEGASVIFGGGQRSSEIGRLVKAVVGHGRDALAGPPASPEGAFSHVLEAARAKGGTADLGSIRALKAALPEDAWGQVAAGALRTLGADGNGHWSPAKYLTEWNKLSPKAKEALFGGEGREGEPAQLDAFARVLGDQVGPGRKYFNHSNSAHAGGALVALFEGGKALMEGDHHMLMVMGALAGLGNLASLALASPGFSKAALRAARAGSPTAAAAADRDLSRVAARSPWAARAISNFQEAIERGQRHAPIVVAGHEGAGIGQQLRDRGGQGSAP